MSNTFEYVNQNPGQSKRLLGIDYQSLQQLIHQAEIKHREIQSDLEKKKTRIIAKGGGRKMMLSIPEQIVLTLTYLRQHTSFQMLGVLFNVSESTAHNVFHYWLKILAELLPESLFAQLEKSESDWAMVQEILEEKDLVVDSSEQERERPADNKEQQKYYSGYKKTLV